MNSKDRKGGRGRRGYLGTTVRLAWEPIQGEEAGMRRKHWRDW